MAIRYSGNIELRIRLVRMRGWDGKVGPFYKARLRAPGLSGEGVLSPREAGVRGDLRSSEAYDRVARAMLDLAREKNRRLVDDSAVREKGLRGLFGSWEVLRVQQAPCPVEEELERKRRGRSRSRLRSRSTEHAGLRKYEARGVLAGAYRGFLKRERAEQKHVTHFYDVTEGTWGSKKTLCGRVLGERLSDLAEGEPASCPACAARFQRRAGKGLAVFVRGGKCP
jgi:hypothetical protein